ncbi:MULTISPECIES: hypothetical protein [Pseudomonas]|uniref:hypothetical protein n=1 Tax=Pseudomonas TaxID=286 RepID=UPI00257E0DB5|nr:MULTISPECIES: hypothetical protein [Pseudomonas]
MNLLFVALEFKLCSQAKADKIKDGVIFLQKLAIISTYDDLCGIAGYTKALVRQLQQDYDVTVFDLDQYLLRSTMRSIRRLGDELIAEIVSKLPAFDVVNIQLEHGTLGATPADIFRRFESLVRHGKPLTVTFHTVLPVGGRGARDLARAVRHLDRRGFFEILHEMRVGRELGHPVMRSLARRQKRAKTSVIFHTRRDARSHKLIYGLDRVFDHPLAFYGGTGKLIPPRTRVNLPAALKAEVRPVVLGIFGFISPYKGIHTAIQALRRLPGNYHLMVFGGLHPNDIRKGYSVHPYLEKVMDLVTDDFGAMAASKKKGVFEGQVNLHIDSSATLQRLMSGMCDISQRVHFMGAVRDDEFASAIQLCDIVVLPYEEVGQSSSGPLAIANDVGARIVCARNKAFLQYERYNPGRLNFFDIGNYLELAQRIISVAESPPPGLPQSYTVETNRAVYKASFEMPSDSIEPFIRKLAGKDD